MNRRGLAIGCGILAVLVTVETLWLWQVHRNQGEASIEVHATNTGVELSAEDARVFVHRTDPLDGPRDRAVVEGTLEEALSLPPGRYDVHVLFTRARDLQSRWLRDITLEAGARVLRRVAFESGELSIESAVNGDGDVVVYVFESGNRERAVTSMPADEPVLLAPGTYDVRVVLTRDAREEAVRWHENVPVKPGLQTLVRVPFRQGTLLIIARNGEQTLPSGAVELTVYRAGDAAQAIMATGLAGVPMQLALGRYDAKATFTSSNDRPQRWLRDISIEEDTSQAHEVSFSSGTATISASTPGGEVLEGFQVYVYFYRAGDHEQAVAYTAAPESVVLESGRYDVRANFFRSHDRPDLWLRDLILPPGGRLERTVEFPSGRLLVRAFDVAGSELIGDTVFVHVYAAGERTRPLATVRSGETLRLTRGDYDVRVNDTRREGHHQWLENVRLDADALVELTVELD